MMDIMGNKWKQSTKTQSKQDTKTDVKVKKKMVPNNFAARKLCKVALGIKKALILALK